MADTTDGGVATDMRADGVDASLTRVEARDDNPPAALIAVEPPTRIDNPAAARQANRTDDHGTTRPRLRLLSMSVPSRPASSLCASPSSREAARVARTGARVPFHAAARDVHLPAVSEWSTSYHTTDFPDGTCTPG